MVKIGQDLRYALRMLRKSPGFSLTAMLTLALGIGLNTAIFSVVYAVLLNPLPYYQPDRLMMVGETDSLHHTSFSFLSYPDFADVRAQNHVFSGIGVDTPSEATLTGNGQPERVELSVISPDLISILGIAPKIGRNAFPGAGSGEVQQGATEAIISERFWKSQLGADPHVLGRSIILDSKPYTIIGVMPASFEFPLQARPVQVWLSIATVMTASLGSEPLTVQRGAHFLDAVARLKPGATLQQARANLQTIGAALSRQYPDSNAHRGFAIVPMKERIVADASRTLLILFGAVGFLLLMACANVANLLMARATTRSKEMAVRTALGASRVRIVRQLLTESVLLSFLGGLAGLVLFAWALSALLRFAPQNVPRIAQAGLNWAVFGFTAGASVLTGILFGLAPALHVAKEDIAGTLKEGGRTATTASHNRTRAVLMTSQFVIAVALLIGAGLLIRSLAHLQTVNPGFHAEHVLAMDVGLPDARYTATEQYEFFNRLKTRLDALPGVGSSSAVYPLPLSDVGIVIKFEVEGQLVPNSDEPIANTRVSEPDYFETMGIPILRGRDFSQLDQEKSTPVVIVNQALARAVFGGEDPIGKHIRLGINTIPGVAPQMREIIGVVGDVHHRSLRADSGMEVYLPQTQVPFDELEVVIRTDGDPLRVANAARLQVNAIDPQLSVASVYPMQHFLDASLAQTRLDTALLGTFAGIALLLASVGLFGMMAYNVAQRTHEIGIRMALGAQPGAIMKQIIGEGLRLVFVGLAIGLPAAFEISRLMESLLFGVKADDPATFVAVALLLAGVSSLAAYVPARRAMRVDPMVALRYE